MPLLVRGARQVGKSFTIEKFGQKNFAQTVTINFELKPTLKDCFRDLDPKKIIRDIELALKVQIRPGTTLLFLDEVQLCPEAIAALRYFKELMSDLHVIAAGSLLEFALIDKNISFPVGRVQSIYMRPLSFLEFLEVMNEEQLIQFILEFEWTTEIGQAVHERLMELVKIYFFVGGMPGAVAKYQATGSLQDCQNYLMTLIDLYRADMAKYATKTQYRYLQILFDRAPESIGLRFKYSFIDPDAKSRDLQTALDQLAWAGLLSPVLVSNCINPSSYLRPDFPAGHSAERAGIFEQAVKRERAAQQDKDGSNMRRDLCNQTLATSAGGMPLQSQVKSKVQKLLYLDIGMLQTALKVDPLLFFREDLTLIHCGALAEQFVGQELIAYANPHDRMQLHLWEREKKDSAAEVDYVVTLGSHIIPIEVKAGPAGKLRSINVFLSEKKSPFGIRICSGMPKKSHPIVTLPFYLVSQLQRLCCQGQ